MPCNSVSADRRGMAASRFLAGASASGILVSFAAQRRESYCSSGMKVANGASAADFLGKDHFLSKSPLESVSNLSCPECVVKGSCTPSA